MLHGYHKADLILLLVTLIAGLGWIFSTEALVGLKPLTFMGPRFLLAGIVLSFFSLKEFKLILKDQLKAALTVSLVFSLNMVLWIEGLYWSQHLGIGAFIYSLGVMLAPLLALLFGDRPELRVWIALPIGMLGLYFLSAEGEFNLGFGEFLFICAAFSMALYINVTTKVAASISPLVLTTIQLCTVGVTLLFLAFFFEGIEWTKDPLIWWWFGSSVLIATSLRFLLQIWAHGLAPTSQTAILLNLEPVWVAIFAVGWFGESMSVFQVLGCTLIFTSVLITRLRSLIKFLRGF